MTLAELATVFVACVLVHNAEEALRLPAWSIHARRWHPRVAAAQFRFAVGMLSVALVAIAVAAFAHGPGSVAAYLFFGYVFAMAANALVPHLAATIALRRYMPGTATGVLLNLPVGAVLLKQAVAAQWVAAESLLWAAPLVAFGLVLSIPVLFALGRRLFPPSG